MAHLDDAENLICASDALSERGRGIRFTVDWHGRQRPAFAIRFRGRVYAYLNECTHRGVELDWNNSEFFALDRHDLICATHGARYAPDSGACVGGPCGGAGLVRLEVRERGGGVFLESTDAIHLMFPKSNDESEKPMP